jgi:hypothetical protein
MKDEYYNSLESRINTLAGGNKFWKDLRSAHLEHCNSSSSISFKKYMRDMYGIDLILDHDSNILSTLSVIDEQKYLIFLLKHGGGNNEN